MVYSFFTKEDGQGMVEYGLILALIAVVVIVILNLVGTNISQSFSTIHSTMS